MAVRVGINGFGRIGRCILWHIVESGRKDIEIVKIGARGPIESQAHLFRYDSVHGRFRGNVHIAAGKIDVGLGPIEFVQSSSPDETDWSDVDIVMECTGKFKNRDQVGLYLKNGAKRVLISAPGKDVDKTVVFGVNHETLTAADRIVSNGSCTTNCLAPLAQTLHQRVGIESGMMTTVHSYTGDQRALDGTHKDPYRARASGLSMVPTTTGAAKAIGEVLPELAGKLQGASIRVPTPNVSCVDLTFYASRTTSVEEINRLIKEDWEKSPYNIGKYDPEPKVSIDFNHTEESAIFAPEQTRVIGGRLVRVLAWYDNEWAFSCRMCDVAAYMSGL